MVMLATSVDQRWEIEVLRFASVTVGLAALYLIGLVAVVAMSIWYLFIDYAGREWLAFLIVMPFAWALGFWPVILPVLSAIKVWRLMRNLETLGDRIEPSAATTAADAKQQLLETLTDVAVAENRLPRWLARRVASKVIQAAERQVNEETGAK